MFKTLIALIFSMTLLPQVMAQQPEGQIRMIVGFSPGGGVDALARITAMQLEKELVANIIVENKPGAGGTLAAGFVASAGATNTLLFGDSSLLVAPHIYPSLRYDLKNDLQPIGLVGESTLTIAVASDYPAKNLEDFLEIAKSSKQSIPYASVGVGSLHHLAGELLAQQTNIDLLHVPYRGGAQASQALASKDVDMTISSLASVMPLVNAGKARILAVLSKDRFPDLPDIPTVGEIVEGYEVTPSLFVMASKDVSPDLVKKLQEKLALALENKELQGFFVKQGSVVNYQDKNEWMKWADNESVRWGKLIESKNINFNE